MVYLTKRSSSHDWLIIEFSFDRLANVGWSFEGKTLVLSTLITEF